MSHAVRIDYEGISIECKSVCELAAGQLCKLDKMLDEVENGAKRLLNSQTKALREEITKTKRQLRAKIDSVIRLAEEKSKKGTVVVDSDYMGKHAGARDIIREAEELEDMVLQLSASKMIEFEALLAQLLSDKLEKQNERLLALADGRIRMRPGVEQRINEMDDGLLKQYVYLAWLDAPEESFERLLKIAAAKKKEADDRTYGDEEDSKIDEIKAELRAERVKEETIEKIVASEDGSAKDRIMKIRRKANAEIVGEKVRKESVKIILRAIKSRGFIVDAGSVRIDREKNQVNIIAMKPGGARAEFKVFLDGRFEYRFDGYEGQACQKDIRPFMKDLEEVYGIKVIKQKELWAGNPDKISSMKYQTTNYNTNRR